MMLMETDNKNSLWLAFQYAVSLVLSLIGLKLNLLSFGNELFGIWLLLLSVWGVGTIMDLGFGMSIIKFISQSKDDHSKTQSIISTSFFLFQILGLGIVWVCILIAEHFYFGNQKLIPLEMIRSSKIVFYILGGNFYLQYLTNVIRAAFEGHNQYKITSKLSLLCSIMMFLGTISILIFNLELVHLAMFTLVTSIVQFTLYINLYKKFFPHLKIKYFCFNKAVFKEIFVFSISIQTTYLLGALIDPLIKYIIGNFSERRLIPSYEIARKFSWAISGFFSFTFRNSLSNTSALTCKEEYKSYLFSSGVSLAIFSIIFSGFFFGIVSFITAIAFQYFYKVDGSLLIFSIFALSETINNAGYILYMLIIGMGKAIFLTLIQATNVIVTSIFLYIGFKLFDSSIGLIGFFISVCISNLAMLLFIKKNTGVKILDLLQKINAGKLFTLLSLLSLHLVIINFKMEYWVLSQSFLVLFSFILFRKDFTKLVNTFYKSIFLFISSYIVKQEKFRNIMKL